jgi:serine/threonine protein kinase
MSLNRLQETLNVGLALCSKFRGGARGKKGRHAIKAKCIRVLRMDHYEGEFNELWTRLDQNIQDLQLALQVKMVDTSGWREQNAVDQKNDMAEMMAMMRDMTDMVRDQSAKSDEQLGMLGVIGEQVEALQPMMARVAESLQAQMMAMMEQFQRGVRSSPSMADGSARMLTTMMQRQHGGGQQQGRGLERSDPYDGSKKVRIDIDPRLSTPLYEIEFKDLICRGSFAAVYTGQWMGHDVAVKSVEQEWSHAVETEFLRECEITSRLRSIYTRQIYAACFEAGRACMVLQLCDTSLDAWIRKNGPPPLPIALDIARDVARGLAFMHKSRYVHRDLKSANVLIDFVSGESTGVCRATLADFGRVRDLNNDDNDQQSAIGVQVGTWIGDISSEDPLNMRWQPPETFTSSSLSSVVDRGDIYSLGIVLWELMSGAPPFARVADNPGQLRKVLFDNAMDTERIFFAHNPMPIGCASTFRDIIKRCVIRFAGGRPSSEDVVELLHESDEIDGAVSARNTLKTTGSFAPPRQQRAFGAVVYPGGSPPVYGQQLGGSASPTPARHVAAPASPVAAASASSSSAAVSESECVQNYNDAVARTKADPARATTLFESVIAHGSSYYATRARTNLGQMLLNSSPTRATQLLEEAATASHARAQMTLVYSYAQVRNVTRARHWLEQLKRQPAGSVSASQLQRLEAMVQ